MTNKKMKQIKNTSIPKTMVIGLIVGWIATIIMCIIMSTIIHSGDGKEKLMGLAAVITLIISTILVSAIVSASTNHHQLLFSVTAGCVYLISLICVNALFYQGTYTGIGYSALTVICCSLIVGLITIRTPRRKRKYKI